MMPLFSSSGRLQSCNRYTFDGVVSQKISRLKMLQPSFEVNISDLPRWVLNPAMTMALSLPSSDPQWLAEFSKSLAQQCEFYGIALVGGDTTRSPCLSVSLTLLGNTHDEAGSTLRRSAAKDGDDLWVTGSLGKGAAALALLTKTVSNEEWPCNLAEKENLIESFNMPQPRLDFGVELLSGKWR